MTDIEIASKVNLKNIKEIASDYGIREDLLELYGNYKAKLNFNKIENSKKGKLILVTSTSPTPYGEGKTTLAIGINDALNKLNKKSIVVLREPSLGPVFGLKGGATGGGYSQVVPMEDINLHFTGDIHAITACNNLLAAIVDNHIFQGNELNINPHQINFKRCLDINDRELRSINLNKRTVSFNISTASEIMAILCLAKDIADLKFRLGNIFIGYTYDNKEIYAKDLNCVGALTVLLKDAIKPNLVQTLEQNLAIIHGGPFANIAHGTNSIISTKMALSLADYAIVEAGFGSDMGGFKYFDIVSRQVNIIPDIVVLNTTIKGLKYNGYNNLKEGLLNLQYHLENMQKFSKNIIVVLNKYENDTLEEIKILSDYCQKNHINFKISEAYFKGSEGCLEVAREILNCSNENKNYKLPYNLEDDLFTKIKKVCCSYLNAEDVIIDEKIKDKFFKINNSFNNLPICIAKTQYSISDNKKLLGNPKNFVMKVTDLNINNGAGYITVCMGQIMTMPGLAKNSNYLNIDLVNDKIIGLF